MIGESRHLVPLRCFEDNELVDERDPDGDGGWSIDATDCVDGRCLPAVRGESLRVSDFRIKAVVPESSVLWLSEPKDRGDGVCRRAVPILWVMK